MFPLYPHKILDLLSPHRSRWVFPWKNHSKWNFRCRKLVERITNTSKTWPTSAPWPLAACVAWTSCARLGWCTATWRRGKAGDIMEEVEMWGLYLYIYDYMWILYVIIYIICIYIICIYIYIYNMYIYIYIWRPVYIYVFVCIRCWELYDILYWYGILDGYSAVSWNLDPWFMELWAKCDKALILVVWLTMVNDSWGWPMML